MGNFNSCISSNLQTATILTPDGDTREIILPITAAELMLDHPGYVISSADLIQQTRLITAIKADNQLCPGKLYIFVPVKRIHSKATPADIELVKSVCKKSYKRSSSKVSPVGVAEGLAMTCQRQRGQWKPVLEPIFEEQRGYVKYLTRLVR